MFHSGGKTVKKTTVKSEIDLPTLEELFAILEKDFTKLLVTNENFDLKAYEEFKKDPISYIKAHTLIVQ